MMSEYWIFWEFKKTPSGGFPFVQQYSLSPFYINEETLSMVNMGKWQSTILDNNIPHKKKKKKRVNAEEKYHR